MTADVTTAPSGLRAAFRSHPGRVRSRNEDLPIVDDERGVYGVIDGVGGHAAGDLAAAIACDVILQRLSRPLGTPAERVREAIAIANNEIFRRAGASADLQGMTCVVTLAVVANRTLTVGHVGDSRLYELRADGIRKLTRDHSPIGEREDAREITEAEAMRHPRRHEVFRDVGSAYRDKDEEDYVDILEERLDGDSAFLLCTDGLSDMVPSAAIARIVKRHAGRPEAVVEALVAAANEAGGKDNVTVVYVEGPQFARAVRGTQAGSQALPAAFSGEHRSRGRSWLTPVRWILHRRTTWFALGALVGVLSALALIWRMPAAATVSSRTLVVGPVGQGTFERIGDAALAARAGDTVRVEPGVYREQVHVADGVHLVARIPSSVTLARSLEPTGEWIAVTATGERGGRIAGLRIESTPDLRIDTGIRVAGQNRSIELVEIEGPMRLAVELLPGAATKIHGSHFAVPGPAIGAGERAQAVLTRNVFLRAGRSSVPPLQLAASAQATIERNLFSGYGADIVAGSSPGDRQQIAAGNVIVTAEPSQVR